jgi:AraC-like DNA-binding protein
MSHVHRMVQHRSVLRWVEARTLTSDRTFPRHSHDQLGIGVMLSGAHRSWSGVGHVEAQSGDIIMVNPGEMHDGMPTLRRHGLRPPPRSESSPSVRKALARLDGDPASPIGLTELAELAGVSRFQLLRGFAREVGTTPHAYLMQRRIQSARRLLVAGRPIVEAAIEAGFADQSHLTRAFVRQFGITPGRYVAAVA